jgi:hypothetical protein
MSIQDTLASLQKEISTRDLSQEIDEWLARQTKSSLKKAFKRLKKLQSIYHVETDQWLKVLDRDHTERRALWVADAATNEKEKLDIGIVLRDYWAIDSDFQGLILFDLIALHKGSLRKEKQQRVAKVIGDRKKIYPIKVVPIMFTYDEAYNETTFSP